MSQTEKKKFSPEEIDAGLTVLNKEYFMQAIALASYDPSLKELTFLKCPVQTPDGGLYLVSIMHVDGPKVDLTKLAESADAKVSETQVGE